MRSRDLSLLLALLVLSVTGLLTLVLRGTAAFAPVLVIHLGAVVACFAIAPYTKFVHVIYRFLALVQDRSAGRYRLAPKLATLGEIAPARRPPAHTRRSHNYV